MNYLLGKLSNLISAISYSNYKMKGNIGVEEGEVNVKVAVCNYYEVVLREKVATCK